MNVAPPVPNCSAKLNIWRAATSKPPSLQTANRHAGDLGNLPLVQKGLYVQNQAFGHDALGPLLVTDCFGVRATRRVGIIADCVGVKLGEVARWLSRTSMPAKTRLRLEAH